MNSVTSTTYNVPVRVEWKVEKKIFVVFYLFFKCVEGGNSKVYQQHSKTEKNSGGICCGGCRLVSINYFVMDCVDVVDNPDCRCCNTGSVAVVPMVLVVLVVRIVIVVVLLVVAGVVLLVVGVVWVIGVVVGVIVVLVERLYWLLCYHHQHHQEQCHLLAIDVE